MKWFLLLFSLTTFTKPYKNINTVDGGTLPTVTVNCNCTTKTTFTSYKIDEPRFNPTRYLSNNVKVKDKYNVPPIIALGGRLKRFYKLGDTVRIMIDRKLYILIYGDNMKHTGKWESINWDRNDILINYDDNYFKIEGIVILP